MKSKVQKVLRSLLVFAALSCSLIMIAACSNGSNAEQSKRVPGTPEPGQRVLSRRASCTEELHQLTTEEELKEYSGGWNISYVQFTSDSISGYTDIIVRGSVVDYAIYADESPDALTGLPIVIANFKVDEVVSRPAIESPIVDPHTSAALGGRVMEGYETGYYTQEAITEATEAIQPGDIVPVYLNTFEINGYEFIDGKPIPRFTQEPHFSDGDEMILLLSHFRDSDRLSQAAAFQVMSSDFIFYSGEDGRYSAPLAWLEAMKADGMNEPTLTAGDISELLLRSRIAHEGQLPTYDFEYFWED